MKNSQVVLICLAVLFGSFLICGSILESERRYRETFFPPAIETQEAYDVGFTDGIAYQRLDSDDNPFFELSY